MKLSTRAAVGSAGVAAVVAGVALTGGTSAFFYDDDTAGVSLQACTLTVAKSEPSVVRVESTGGTPVASSWDGERLSLSNVEPGDELRILVSATNTGTCSGDLYADLSSTGGSPDFLAAATVMRGSTAFLTARENAVPLADVVARPPVKVRDGMAAGASARVGVFVAVPLGERGQYNEIQGQELVLDLDLGLVQTGQNPGASLKS